MKSWKKWIITGVIIILALLGAVQAAFKAVSVDTQTAKKEDVTATVVDQGKLVSEGTSNVYSEVAGKVKAIYVDEGDTITKGTVLAVIDGEETDEKIAQMEGELKAVNGLQEAANMQSGGNAIKEKELALEQAKVAYNLAYSAYTRAKKLFDQGAGTAAELEQAKGDLESKQKAVSQAQASLAALKSQSSGDKLNYQGQKESIVAQLNYLRSQRTKNTIVANRDGVVYSKKVKVDDPVSVGTQLFTLGAKGQEEIEVYVNNEDMAYINIGNEVKVTFKQPGKDVDVPGQITKIAPVIEEKVSSLGIEEDKVKVTLVLKKQPKYVKLTSGMSVDVTLVTQEAKHALAVSKDAVFTDNDKDYVWVVNNGKAQMVEVQKGIEGDELMEIKQGIKEGDKVILNPHLPELKEGVRVK